MKSSPPKLSLRTAKGLGNIILILFKNLQLKGMAETLGRILRKSPFFLYSNALHLNAVSNGVGGWVYPVVRVKMCVLPKNCIRVVVVLLFKG